MIADAPIVNGIAEPKSNGVAYIRVALVEEFQIGKAKRIIINETAVAIYQVDGEFHAIEDTCPHAGGSLAFGKLEGHTVACPRHGAMFDVRTGRVISLPAVRGVKSYSVKVEDGVVYVSSKPAGDSQPSIFRIEQ